MKNVSLQICQISNFTERQDRTQKANGLHDQCVFRHSSRYSLGLYGNVPVRRTYQLFRRIERAFSYSPDTLLSITHSVHRDHFNSLVRQCSVRTGRDRVCRRSCNVDGVRLADLASRRKNFVSKSVFAFPVSAVDGATLTFSRSPRARLSRTTRETPLQKRPRAGLPPPADILAATSVAVLRCRSK
jgi:hypothetical protein